MNTVHRYVTMLTALALATMTMTVPASAAPPDGCYGLPDVPDAFLCISGFDPENALPAAEPNAGTTVIVPRFCVDECFGPTPVTIPGYTVTPGSEPVMTLHYKGQDYPIVAGEIPALPPPAQGTPDPSGKLCTLIPGGDMEGGPLVLGDDTDPAAVYEGSMTCAVQSGDNNLYDAADDASVTGETTRGTASVAGTVTVPSIRPLYVCTSVTITGFGTLNYDYPTGTWVAAPGGECVDLPYEPFGFLCGFTSTTDPTGEENVQTGVMDGGPLVITDEYRTSPPSGSITCTIQTGANSTHAGTDAFTATGPTTSGVVVLPETQVLYEATEDENVYLCAQVNLGGGTLYWDDSNDPLVEGAWSTSPTVDCGLAISTSTPGEDEFPFDVLLPLACGIADLLPGPVRDLLGDLFGCWW